MIKIYSAKYCPFCRMAIDTLFRQGVSFEVIDISDDQETKEQLIERTGCKTIPQIFVKEQFIGGSSDLDQLILEGKFEQLLKD